MSFKALGQRTAGPKVIVDLFSGTGGATAAFRGRPGYRVVTVEIERRHKPDVVADVRTLPLALGPVTLAAAEHRKSEFRNAVTRATVPASLSRALYEAVERSADVRSLLELRPFRRHRHQRARGTAAPDLFAEAACSDSR